VRDFDIKWIATALFITSGTFISLRLPGMQYAFPVLVIAHSILVYEFYFKQFNKPLVIHNAYFAIVNAFATYIWMAQ